jgi:hypothetical protein
MKKTVITIGALAISVVALAQSPLKMKYPSRPHDVDCQAKNFAIMGTIVGLTVGAVAHPIEPVNPEIIPPGYDKKYTSEMIREGERANNMTTLYTVKSVLIGGASGAIVGMGVGMVRAYIQNKHYKYKVAEYRKQKELARQLKTAQVYKY